VTYTIVRPDSAGAYEGYHDAREGTTTAEELSRLHDLRTQGAISDEEYADLKARTIAAT
jgi:hypothetical protein